MEWLFNIVGAVIIPFVVQYAKKLKVSSKVAPYLALLLGIIYAFIISLIGQTVDAQAIINAILQGLGIGGASIVLYDIKKTIKA